MESKSTNPTLNNTSIADELIRLVKARTNTTIEPRSIFSNYSLGHGTCLTARGFELLLPIIQFYPVDIGVKFRTKTTKNKILLARALQHPYYFEKNKLWLSNSQDAFTLALVQGDIEAWAASLGLTV